MRFLRFLTKKKFYINFGIAIGLTGLLFWLIFVFLGIYTRHGDTIVVPDFSGSTIEDLDNENLANQFEFILLDSIYDPDHQRGTIIQQDPLPYAKVKEGRKVYITVVAKLPEKVGMPNLVDLSLRQALVTLETEGLEVEYLEYVDHFAENAVLAQFYRGDTIQPGTLIEKNSKIRLLIGEGHGNPSAPVPFLIGRKIPEAHEMIHLGTFNIGKEYFMDDQDSIHARVYKQSPTWEEGNTAYHGAQINVWYRSELDFDFEEYIQSLLPDTIIIDSLTIDTLNIEALNELDLMTPDQLKYEAPEENIKE